MIGCPSILPYASIPPSAKGIKSPNAGINWPAYWKTQMLDSYKSINSHITFTEEQEALILERLGEDYILTTFGRDGLNKTVCDFFLFFENSNTTTNLTARGITKTGDTLRWNYGGGNVYSQNNLPAQTNNGVITITSTDGFNAVTSLNLSVNTFTGGLFDLEYYMPALTVLNVGTNAFAGAIPPIPDTMVQFDISANSFTSGIPADFADLPDMTEFKCYQNYNLTGEIVNTTAAPDSNLNTLDCLETKITGISLTSFSPVMVLLRVQSCDIPTVDLDALLAGLNTFHTTYGAFANLTINLTGDFNGYITDGLLNTDYVALQALWAGAGKTLTCSFNSNPGAFNKGKVAFTFDDVALSIHTLGLPLFNSKSITGTVYANNAYVGEELPYGEDGCDWAELLALEAAGWTVGSHGDTHVPYATLSEAQMIADVEASIAEFVSEGLTSPLFFSYPQGSYNATSKGVMQTHFRSSRIVGNLNAELQTAFLGKNSDPYLTPCVFTDLAQYTMADLDLVKKYIDKANADKTAIIFLTHGIAVTPTDEYHISTAFLTAIIDYIQTLDMDIVNQETLTNLMYCDKAEALFTRMTAASETPIEKRKTNINIAINDLRAANLFENQFDVLVITDGKGTSSTKMNWIKNSSNAIAVLNGGTLTETEDVGYNSDGLLSYLNTKYAPATNGVLFIQNDACFGVLTSGTIGTGDRVHGIIGGSGVLSIQLGNVNIRFNSSAYAEHPRVIGYDCLTRNNNTKVQHHQNADTAELDIVSTGVSPLEGYVLGCNLDGGLAYPCETTEVLKSYWFGKYLSQANFLIFQGIMNRYITRIAAGF